MSYFEFLRNAIKDAHGCDCRHVKTVFVTEEFQGAVWEGEVDVFELRDHPTATQCYAWWPRDQEPNSDPRVQVMLALPPATTPELAIRSFLATLGTGQQGRG
jgi:hypothetical protein